MANVAPIDAKLPQYRKDIAASLRAVADSIESGEYQPSLLMIVHDCDKDESELVTYSQGRRADDVLACIGLLELAKLQVATPD